jgi:signal peptidase I
MSEKHETEQAKPQLTRGQEFTQDLYFWLQALTMALVVLILLFTFVGRIISVDGPSMMPTLHHGDMLLLRSIGYTPKQGDVVVLTKDFSHYVDQPIVKRVIAVGGQTVRIDYDESKVYVDGVALDEPYINEAIMVEPGGDLTISELTVPEGSVFVLGDNRNNSSDSRHWQLGAIDNRYILGEAVMILLPFQDFGIL